MEESKEEEVNFEESYYAVLEAYCDVVQELAKGEINNFKKLTKWAQRVMKNMEQAHGERPAEDENRIVTVSNSRKKDIVLLS